MKNIILAFMLVLISSPVFAYVVCVHSYSGFHSYSSYHGVEELPVYRYVNVYIPTSHTWVQSYQCQSNCTGSLTPGESVALLWIFGGVILTIIISFFFLK